MTIGETLINPTTGRPCVGGEDVGQDRVEPGRPNDGAQGPADAGNEQGKIVAIAAVNAYGSRRAPTPLTSIVTIFRKAPIEWSIAPISTPKPMSRPTTAMISPKPVAIAVIVAAKRHRSRGRGRASRSLARTPGRP
jgi:hypothetical protein